MGSGKARLFGSAGSRRSYEHCARQALLSRMDGPTLRAIVDKVVLWRPIGEPGVMHSQLQHLLNLARRPRIDTRVAPFGAGANPDWMAHS